MFGIIALWSLVLAAINFFAFYVLMNVGYKKDTDSVYFIALCCFVLAALCLLLSGVTGLIWLIMFLF